MLLSFLCWSDLVAAQPTGYQEYYVLGYEEHIWRAFLDIYDGPDEDISNQICSTVSLVATADHQTIYYDHWEDGYEADIFNPVQLSTKVYHLDAGEALSLTSDQDRCVPVPRDSDDFYYDGGDRVYSSGGPVDLAHAMWPQNGTWVGGAWEIYSRQSYANAYSYRLPIGEDLYTWGGGNYGAYGDLRDVYLQLQAFEDNSTVSIDNGQDVVNLTLDRGQTYFSLGYINSSPVPSISIHSGTWIRSNKPTQVGLVTGADSPDLEFQGRFLVVLPDLLWGADHVVPVPSGSPVDHDGDEAEIYLSNPNDFPIEVQAYDLETQVTFIISPTGYISAAVPYSTKRGGLGYVPQDSAARFTSADGTFGVVVCADTSDVQYDWGFSGVPSKYLTRDYYVSWAPGSANKPPGENGSPVWVTPLADHTTFYVDFSPLDGAVDQIFNLSALQQRRIFDPDNDNTGMHIWATDEFAVAWGEDPRTADLADPYLDLGLATLPTNRRWLDPVMTVDKTVEPSTLPPEGGVVTFTLVAQSYNVILAEVNLTDTLPLNWAYVPGSSVVTYPNGQSRYFEPKIAGQNLFWNLATKLQLNQSLTLTFRSQITQTGGITLNAYDGFESGGYSGGQNWAGDWQESGDDGNPNTGQIRNYLGEFPFAGQRHLRIRGSNSNPGPYSISRAIDLSAFVRPFLYFARRTESLEAGEYFHLDVYDGNDWTTVMSWTDGDQEGMYIEETVDLSPYADAGSVIRFQSSGIGGSDYFYFDQVKVYEGLSISVNRGEATGQHWYSGGIFNPGDDAIVYLGPLDLAKSVSQVKAEIGDTLVYTLSYANVSPSLAVTNATLRDAVPIQHVTFSSASDGGVYNGASGTVNWLLDTLAPGASGYVTFSVRVNDFVDNGTLVENQGSIGGDQVIPVGSNVARTAVLAPEVWFTKLGPTVAAAGQVITYALFYENTGGVDASEVVVWDTIPYSTTYVAGSLAILTDTQWIPLTDAPGDDQGAFISPTLIITPGGTPGTLTAGEAGQIRFSARIQDDLPTGSRVLNTGTLGRRLGIPRDSNTVVTRISDLTIYKSAEQTIVTPGDVISYALTYSNHSPVLVQTDVYVREPIPDYTRFITASGGDLIEYSWDNGASWTTTLPITPGLSPTHIRWHDAILPPASQETVNFSVKVNATLPEGTAIHNIAHVTSTQVSEYLQEWIPSNQVEVNTVDLCLNKGVDRTVAWGGELLTYTLVYGNHGTADAQAVQLQDTVPSSTTYVPGSIWGTGADDSGAPDLLWNLGEVAANNSAEAGYVVQIYPDPPRGTQVTNTAALSSPYGVLTSNLVTVTVNLYSIISGVVFEDANGNGLQDGGEAGIPGVTLTLDDEFTFTTDVDGGYVFSVTADSTHSLVESDPPGYFSTTPNTITLRVVLNQDYEINFGDAPTSANFAAIYGIVFEDLNGDGVQNKNETGIPVAPLALDGITVTTTNLYGSYTFSTTVTGTHVVAESDPPGYFSTTPNTMTLSVDWGQGYQVDFGDAPEGLGWAAIYGTVFEDLNANGLQDGGEPGLAEVMVTFDQSAPDATNRYGAYTFSTTQASVHSLIESDPPGYFSTTPNTVTLDTEPGSGYQVDFGDVPEGVGFAAIYGTVFNDVNGDGIWDLDEGGVRSVLITLDGTASNLTNLYGGYTFSTTITGTHVISETDLPYYRSTTSDTVQIDVALDHGYAVNFGDQPLTFVQGCVFEDTNGNGVRDGGEAGVPSVTVSLDGGVATVDTNAGGYYVFVTEAGIHTVVESDPDGYFSTTPNTVTLNIDWDEPGWVDFGDLADDADLAAIYGIVFEDLDGNGVQDGLETGLSGVLVTLDGSVTVSTNLYGAYTLPTSQAGVHTIAESDPAGYFSTTPAEVHVSVQVGHGYRVDFGGAPDDADWAAIYGAVFEDLNGNGLQDADELGLSGVTVTLDDVTSTTTGPYGGYTLSTTIPGAHAVVESDLPAHFSTTPNEIHLAVNQGNGYRVDFGDAPNGSGFSAIYGTVFKDANGDGLRDLNELGIRNVQVTLDGRDTATDLYGSYTLSTTTTGHYLVVETDPAGYFSTTPNEVALNVAMNEDYQVDFGDAPQDTGFASVFGVVFADLDGDGVQDVDEVGLPDVLITLDGILTTTTDASGSYTFNTITGTHTVVESDPPGYFSTTPNEVHVIVEVSNGYRVDFGDAPEGSDLAAIYGTVFEDLDGDGSQNDAEPGLADVTVTLDGGVIAVTGPYGGYTFSTTVAGTHVVLESDPPGYFSTTPNEVHLDVALNQGYRVDFGDAPEGSDFAAICGVVFEDLDGDGVQDESESEIPGVIVTLDGGVIAVTGPYGGYTFSTTVAGTHVVLESDPPGYFSTTPNEISLDVELDRSYQVDFGDAPVGSGFAAIYGIVFEDLDGDGLHDVDETGLPGVTVRLDGALVAVTNPGGVYVFSTTLTGAHTVVESDPPGYFSTTPNEISLDVEMDHSYQVDFGDAPNNSGFATIYGVVFEDVDGDGERNAGEVGISNALITLNPPGSGQTVYASTDLYGSFTFSTTGTGLYVVLETDPPGYRSTTPNRVHVYVDLMNRGYPVDFGDVFTGTFDAVPIYGTVFNDTNKNGQRDPNEVGLRDVNVNLGGRITDTTDLLGRYSFNTTLAGPHTVFEADLDGYISTTPNTVTLMAEPDSQYEVDFGDLPDYGDFAPIHGIVFEDLNGDGLQDGEPGLSGVLVTLNISDTGASLTTTTGLYGIYVLSTTVPGSHALVEADPPDYFSTTPNTITLIVALGNSYRVDWGDAPIGSGFAAIYGIVFEDLDENGVQDGEPGIRDVTLDLDAPGGARAQTGRYGHYTFSTTITGDHTLVEIDPPGYLSTTPNQVSVTVVLDHGYQRDFGDVLICACPPDGYEDDDAPARAADATLGLSQAHDFCDDATDWVTFTARAETVYTLTTSAWGQRADTLLALFDTDGRTWLAANDDCEGVTDYSSCIVWQAPADGVYYLRASNQAGLTGCYTDYDLLVGNGEDATTYLPIVMQDSELGSTQIVPTGVITHTCPDDYELDDTWQQAKPIEPGVGQIHSFDSDVWTYAADKDFVWFELETTHTVTLVARLVTGTLVLSDRVLLALHDASGNTLGVTGTGQLRWADAGRYYLRASPRQLIFGCADEPGAGYILWLEVAPVRWVYLPLVLREP